MKKLTLKQKLALKRHSNGKTIREIIKETGYNRSSTEYALQSGISKLENAIELIKFAIENEALDNKQVLVLKTLLNEL